MRSRDGLRYAIGCGVVAFGLSALAASFFGHAVADGEEGLNDIPIGFAGPPRSDAGEPPYVALTDQDRSRSLALLSESKIVSETLGAFDVVRVVPWTAPQSTTIIGAAVEVRTGAAVVLPAGTPALPAFEEGADPLTWRAQSEATRHSSAAGDSFWVHVLFEDGTVRITQSAASYGGVK